MKFKSVNLHQINAISQISPTKGKIFEKSVKGTNSANTLNITYPEEEIRCVFDDNQKIIFVKAVAIRPVPDK